jgi:hypothetical protein
VSGGTRAEGEGKVDGPASSIELPHCLMIAGAVLLAIVSTVWRKTGERRGDRRTSDAKPIGRLQAREKTGRRPKNGWPRSEGKGEIARYFSRYRRPMSAAFAGAPALEVDREWQHIE